MYPEFDKIRKLDAELLQQGKDVGAQFAAVRQEYDTLVKPAKMIMDALKKNQDALIDRQT